MNAPPPAPAIVKTTLIVGALLALALLAWTLSDVLLLAFAAVLFAVILRSLATPIERHLPLGPSMALVVVVLSVAALVAVFGWVLGAQIQGEVRELAQRTPELLASLGEQIGVEDLQERLARRFREMLSSRSLAGQVASYTSWAVGVIANIVLAIAAGIYLAANPERYRRGLVALLPPPYREAGRRFLDNAAHALRLWLLGTLVSMVLVGALTTAGLYALGIPSPLALGLIAALLEFVPLVGPVLAAIPAVLFALSEGGTTVLWVIGLYVLIQQMEGNLIQPLVQRRAVHLPPVVTLFAILSFGLLFGALGILLGTPLAVVALVAVRQLYIRRVLGEPTHVPGEVPQAADARPGSDQKPAR